MENEKSKIGELFKKAFEDFKPEPSPTVWEKISNSPSLQQPGKPASGTSWWTVLVTSVSISMVIIALLFVFNRQQDEKDLAPEPAPMQLSSPEVLATSTDPVIPASNQETTTITLQSANKKADKAQQLRDGKTAPSRPEGDKTVKPIRTATLKLDSQTSAKPPESLNEKVENQIFKQAPPRSTQTVVAATDQVSLQQTESATNTGEPFTKEGIEIIESQHLCKGEKLTLWVNGGTSYSWSTGESSSSIIVNPVSTTTFTVTVTDHSGQLTTSDIRITVVDCKSLYIPNAFSPNNDGHNDEFKVFGTEISNFTLRIVSRTGQIIFETSDINEGWDGRIKGDLAEFGIYIYQVSYTDAAGKSHKETGQLTLIK